MAKLTKAQWEARQTEVRKAELPASGTLTLDLAGAKATLPAMLREFSTGSRGYGVSERLSTEHGAFQVNVTITQIGSGPYKGDK